MATEKTKEICLNEEQKMTTFNENLKLLKKAFDEIKIIQKSDKEKKITTNFDDPKYKKIVNEAAPAAVYIYNTSCKEPRLPVMLIINRYISSEHLPEFIKFWENIDAIEALYLALEEDGFYKKMEKEEKNGSA